jgi:hypothetical protein
MTKVITSVTALRLVEAGRLGLDQSLDEWLPELADRRVLTSPTAPLDDTVPAHRPITLRHLPPWRESKATEMVGVKLTTAEGARCSTHSGRVGSAA